ncbi:GntR family transcriptional regulator [Thalassospira profundimaris]|uniref:GntR family transcriptional regulator n=1 Tax=Thalassospira profundimaris TaxID=502049 RepID=A0A367XMB0_9PROT|nr:GntR family transcriptional regulator [Thalassospira profundimaris]RCK53862.1 GntR family transcriptional regulator [Thalassospira profundimaris]
MDHDKDTTITGKITRQLADRIIAGHIAPGTKLRQDHLAEEFGASHVPVREAFRRLEAQGLVVSEPRRGVRVASFDIAEVREVAEMRASLEVLALRHAAPHLTSAILDEAEAINRAGENAADVRAWEETNRAFHRLILSPCNMPRLLATIDDLHAASARFLFSGFRLEWEAPTDQDHRAILKALRERQFDVAAATLARHVKWIGSKPGIKPRLQNRA